jgi:hypothetical protein
MKPLARVVVAVVSLAAVATSYLLPNSQQTFSSPASEFAIDVNPLPLSIVCPGSMVEVAGRSGVEVGKIERVDSASIKYQSQNSIEAPSRTESFTTLAVEGEEQSTNLLSAIEYQVVDRPRASGLIAGYCEQPVTSGWFVSGDGGAGKETVLVVANPNPVDTQLLLEIHFAGKVITERYVIGPLSEKLISLAAVVGVEPSYAVYFESGGGGLVAAIQHRYSDGLNSLGVSLDTAVRQAQTNLWIAPVSILADGYERPRLRLFAPTAASDLTITYHSRSTRTQMAELSLDSGELFELEPQLPPGTYAIEIQSTEPVLASILNPALRPLDYQWISPSERFNTLSLPLPSIDTELALVNPSDSRIRITVEAETAQGNQISTIELAPTEIELLPVTGRSISIDSSGEFIAALQLISPSGYAVINPSENSNPGQSLSVIVR